MKNSISLLLILLCITGFSQNSRFEYQGRLKPSVNKEKLNEANFISDLTPELLGKLLLPYYDRDELINRRKTDFSQVNFIAPREYDYNKIVDYVSVEILATCNGKARAAQSTSDKLTTEQKNILNTADLGTDISLKIRFKLKNNANDKPGTSKIIEGKLAVEVIPEIEAEYQGGFKQFSEYFNKNVIDKISGTGSYEKLMVAIINFSVNEGGQIVDAKIFRTSADPRIDKLLLDATNAMPKWKPAENSKGVKVKQEFSIPIGGGGC